MRRRCSRRRSRPQRTWSRWQRRPRLELLKKKKAAADAKAKSKTKTAAKGTVDKNKQAAAAKAKAAKAEKDKLAKAKADKDKLIAAKAVEKKKLEAAAKAKAAEKLKLEAAAKAKAAEKLKLAAKAKAEKDKLAAIAKAEREKQLAAKAKADEAKRIAKAKADEATRIAKAKADEERKVAKAKVDEERRIAKAKADEERRIARAKADEERRLAWAKAAEERQIAKAKAAEERRLLAEAKLKAAEEKRMAKIRAEEARRLAIAQAAEAARQAEIARLVSMEVVQTGNNGELRSENQPAPKPVGLFAGLFGGSSVQKQSMLPETRALDAALEQKEGGKKFVVRPEFEPQVVQFAGYPRGTIVIDTASHYLYLMEGSSQRAPLCHRCRQGRPAVQGSGRGRRQAGMAALDPDQGDAAARPGQVRPVRGGHARRRTEPARRPRHLPVSERQGHASAHPWHDRAGDDRNRFVQWLLPHDQRARHGSLQARAGRNQRRHPVGPRQRTKQAGITPACFVCAPPSARRSREKPKPQLFSLVESIRRR